MTKKLMLGIFLASLLLLTNLAFAGEKSSPTPAVTKMEAVSSDCGCLKKDKVPAPVGLESDVLVKKPDLTKFCPGGAFVRCYRVAWGQWCVCLYPEDI